MCIIITGGSEDWREREQEIIQITPAVNQMGGGSGAATPGWPAGQVNPPARQYELG